MVVFGHNTKKSPGNVRRPTVTQNLVENHQLTLSLRTTATTTTTTTIIIIIIIMNKQGKFKTR